MKQSKYQEILQELRSGICTYGNKNTGFILTADGEMLMCEYHLDCKYTRFFSIEKFARRINRFYKIGY